MAIDDPLSFQCRQGKSPDALIFEITGPITLRNMFALQHELRSNPPKPLTVLEMSNVPYMDSAGLGLIVNYYVRCQNKGTKMFAAGVCCRVLDLFKLTRVDTVIPMAETVEEAEAKA
jgi:anti-sigma B factor antagonist